MSSSRSIAAARNRRAGEQQPVQTRSGPGTSIASQAAFVQQMNQDQRMMGGRNQMPQNKQMSQNKQMNQQQPQVAPLSNGMPAGAKLSISDAIGLITLRLGKVEQFIIQLENEILPSLKGESNVSDHTQQIDRSVINSIVNRLDALEKSQKEILSGNMNLNKDNFDNTKIEKEIRDIKDALMMQIVKYDKFSDSTNQKITDIHQRLTDIDNAFVEFENQFSIQNINDDQTINDINNDGSNVINDNLDDNDDTSSNFNSDNAISSVDLKSIIKEQLKEL
jgi:hypothetical protein